MAFRERELRSSFRPGPSQRQQRMPMSPSPQLAGVGKSQAAGGFLPMIATAAVSAIGSYFTAKSQARAQERGWQHQLELERMRIEAEKELERIRNTIDPAIYAMLKKELTKPLGTHGGGRPPTGTYRKMLEPQPEKSMPAMSGGGVPGGSPDEFNRYLMGGK